MRRPTPLALVLPALILPALVLPALVPAAGARAQSFSGAGPARPFVMPTIEAARAPEPTAPVAPAPPVVPVLKRLANHPDGPRLVGETASREWPLVLTQAQVGAGGTVQIAYRAAVSILPGLSTLTLAINGTVVGVEPIEAPREIRTVAFAVPPGLLVRGANAVRLTVEQRHRVDCSVAATHELWTQLDGSRTGLVLPAEAAGVTDLADLAAVLPAASGATPVRVVLPGAQMSPWAAERAVLAVQALAVAGRFAEPAVDFGPPASGLEGLNLAVGPASALALLVDPGAVSGPRLLFLPATPERRATLVATGRDEAEVDAALAALAPSAPTGTPAGIRALDDRGGRASEGDERIALSDLGFRSTEFDGRMFRAAFDLALPHDVWPADTAKVAVDLAGAYARGLAPGAQIRIEVNGQDAASLDLGRAGDVFRHNPILFPLGRLRPGRNRIAITAALPRPEDAACLEAAGPPTGRGEKRFLLLDSTALVLPPLARIARAPELAHAAAGGFPFAGRRPALVVPSPARDTMGAAATLVARLAVAAGAPIPFTFATARPAGSEPALVVAPAASVEPSLWTALGLDPALPRVWASQASRRGPAREDAVCGMSAPSREMAALAVASPAAPAVDRDLVGEWSATVGGRWSGTALGTGFAGLASGIAESAAGGVRRVGTALANLVPGAAADPARPEALAGAALLVAQGAPDAAGEGGLVLVTAPHPAALVAGVACLVDPRVWSDLAGRLALLGADGLVGIPAASPALVATRPLSLGNARRVGAAWLSLHPVAFALAGVLAALGLAGATTWLVAGLGRRHG